MPEVIAEDISVPERLRTVVGAAPCPLCSLQGPKWFHGMLMWYRQEKALRVIGHECTRKFYGAGFDAEIAASRMKREDNSTRSFLIDNLCTVHELREAVEILLPRSRMLVHGDKLSEALLSRADQALALLDDSNDDAILAALNALGIEGRAKAGKDLYAAWDLLIQAHELCEETQQFKLSRAYRAASHDSERTLPS